MPYLDMPIEKLKIYKGVTPCPADFDEYWDVALAEADSLDYKAEIIESTFKAKNAICYDVFFTGTKGARVHGKLVKPKDAVGKFPTLIRFHGLGGDAGEWSSMLWPLANNQCMAAMDCRGQGGLSEDVGGKLGTTQLGMFTRGLDGDKKDLLMRDVFLDTYIFAKIIMGLSFVDENRIGVLGGSQGGALSLVCASLVPSVKKCAICYPYLCDYKRVWDMDLGGIAYDGIKRYFRNHDPLHEKETQIFERLGYIDVQNLVKRIRADVMMATGMMDTTCPPSTQFAAYNKIISKKQHLIYPDYGHEPLKGQDDLTAMFLSEL